MFEVGAGALIVCLDDGVSEAVAEGIGKLKEQLDKTEKTNLDLEKNREMITKENSDCKKKNDHYQEEV